MSMTASEVRTLELEGTADGIMEVLEFTNWNDFGEDRSRKYRLWIDERWYRDVNVSVEEVC
jgi:hypothetical protein